MPSDANMCVDVARDGSYCEKILNDTLTKSCEVKMNSPVALSFFMGNNRADRILGQRNTDQSIEDILNDHL